MGSFESLPVSLDSPLLPALLPLSRRPLSVIRSLWDSCRQRSLSLPYVTLSVFAECNTFLTSNQIITSAKHFETKGTVNMHEFISVLTLFSSADWQARAKFLFGLFDFDGSSGLSKEECVILTVSVYAGFAKATGQQPISSKEAIAFVSNGFAQVRSMRELSEEAMTDQFEESGLHRVGGKGDTRKHSSGLFAFHKSSRGTTATPLSTNASTISRKSSRLSQADHSSMVNKSFQRSREVCNSSRTVARGQVSLPPATRRPTKGLVIDGEPVTKRGIRGLQASFLSASSHLTGCLTCTAPLLPLLSKKAGERLRRQMEGEGGVDFEALVRIMFPRATNTQVAVLLRWAKGGRREPQQRAQIRTPLQVALLPGGGGLQGEFFIIPSDSRTPEKRKGADW